MSQNLFYPTASNVTVYINGYHIDQAYRLDYRESTPKIPLYGYNDYHYGRVLEGRTMLNGMLIINFIFSGYLNYAIKKIKSDDHSPFSPLGRIRKSAEMTRRLLRENAPQGLDPESRAERAEYLTYLLRQARDPEEARAIKREIERQNSIESDGAFDDPEEYVRPDVSLNEPRRHLVSPLREKSNSPVDMVVYFDNPETTNWHVIFRDVHFTEINQQMSQAGAEGSSEPLYEIYNFIARKKDIITI